MQSFPGGDCCSEHLGYFWRQREGFGRSNHSCCRHPAEPLPVGAKRSAGPDRSQTIKLDPTRQIATDVRLESAIHTPRPEQYTWTREDEVPANPTIAEGWLRGANQGSHYFRRSFHLKSVPRYVTHYVAGSRQERSCHSRRANAIEHVCRGRQSRHDHNFKAWPLALQLYFVQTFEKRQEPGPEGHVDSLCFRGLKPTAPSEIFDLQL